MTNAAAERPAAEGSNSRRPNSRPAKTRRFLLHWPGRSAVSSVSPAGRIDASREEASGIANVLHLGRGQETLDRVAFRVEGLEHGQQLGDGEQVGDAFGEVDQFQAAGLTADRRVGADDF